MRLQEPPVILVLDGKSPLGCSLHRVTYWYLTWFGDTQGQESQLLLLPVYGTPAAMGRVTSHTILMRGEPRKVKFPASLLIPRCHVIRWPPCNYFHCETRTKTKHVNPYATHEPTNKAYQARLALVGYSMTCFDKHDSYTVHCPLGHSNHS